MNRKYPLFDIYWDDKDIESVNKVIKRGSYWALGPEIQEFEEKLAEYLNIKFSVTFNSGTSALHAVLLANDLTSGEIIIPSMSFISTANSVVLAGAKPIFAEIEEESLGLDIEDINEKITKKTRAILPIHYGGRVCKYIREIKELADDNNLILIEDNAESLGAKINEQFAGTIGDAGMLSFCQNKIITTGEGGAICTNNESIYNRLKLIRSHGRVENQKPGSDYFSTIKEMDYIEVGYNYRMPTMNAALGLSQLNKIENIIKLRREKAKYYDKILDDISEVKILPELNSFRNVYQLYSIFLTKPDKRTELQDYLLKNNIYTKVYFHPIHLKTFYRDKFGHHIGDLPKTEEISKKLLTLPISLRFKQEDQDYIRGVIRNFFNI